MAEQLAMVKLKGVGTLKSKDEKKPKPKPPSMMDLLKQQIDLRFKNLRIHEDKNDDEEEENEEE